MTRLLPWFLVLAVMVAPACTESTGTYGEEEILVLEVAPDSVSCVGEATGMCIQVRSPGEDEWRIFYDPIEGFQHQVGILYTLEVARREVLDPPANGSAYEYRLVRILDQEPAGS